MGGAACGASAPAQAQSRRPERASEGWEVRRFGRAEAGSPPAEGLASGVWEGTEPAAGGRAWNGRGWRGRHPTSSSLIWSEEEAHRPVSRLPLRDGQKGPRGVSPRSAAGACHVQELGSFRTGGGRRWNRCMRAGSPSPLDFWSRLRTCPPPPTCAAPHLPGPATAWRPG